MNTFCAYLYNWGVLFSQFISVILGGHPDDSISERTARAYIYHKGSNTFKEKWFYYQLKFIDFIIFFEDNHTLNSISDECNAKELWKWDRD